MARTRTVVALVLVVLLSASLAWSPASGKPAPGLRRAPAAPADPYSPTWQDQIVYVLIPHKFFDGDLTNDIMKDRYHLPNPAYQGGFLGGDIEGIRQKMAYLKSLGETSVLVYPMLFNDEEPFFQYLATGYRVKDYQRVDPNFGTEQDLAGMIADFHSAANGRRVGVIMDLPIGMTGLEHPWVADAPDYPWYFRPWNPIASENIAAAPAHLPYGDVDNAFGMDIINHTQGMDTGTSTYAALRDDIVFWLTDHYDIDGFRYDSAQNADPEFWRQLLLDFRARYGASKPNFMQVAEAFVLSPKKTWQVWADEFMDARVNNHVGPIQMDGAYDFDLINHIQDVFARGADVEGITDSMDFSGLVFEHPERLMASVDNYEDPTFLSTVTGGHGRQKLFLAETFLLTADRVPLVYSGNEYGIDYSEPGALFQPGLDPAFLARFKQLTMIRRTRPAFHRGTRRWLERTPTILSYLRSYQGTNFVVVLNNANTAQSVTVKLGSRGIPCSSVRNLLKPNDAAIHLNDPGTPTATLSADLSPYEPKIVACAT